MNLSVFARILAFVAPSKSIADAHESVPILPDIARAILVFTARREDNMSMFQRLSAFVFVLVLALSLGGCAASSAPAMPAPDATAVPALEANEITETTEPEERIVEVGASDLDDVPPPVLCNPKNPDLAPIYTEGGIEQDPDTGIYRAAVVYHNRDGQFFRLVINSQSKSAIEHYLKIGSVCFESILFRTEYAAEDPAIEQEGSSGKEDSSGSLIYELLSEPESAEEDLVIEVDWLDPSRPPQPPTGGDQPDLIIVEIAGNHKASAGDEISLSWAAANQGSMPAPGNVPGSQPGYIVDVILSSDDHIPMRRTAMSQRYAEDMRLSGGEFSETPDLEPFQVWDKSVVVALPAEIPTGDYELCVRVDARNEVDELDETNNTQCQSLSVEGNIDPGPARSGGERFAVHFVIHPDIGTGKHNYVAKCRYSANVRITAKGASATTYLWDIDPGTSTRKDWGFSTAQAGGSSIMLSGSSGTEHSYDTRVKGNGTGASYEIYGTWTENDRGRGGGC